MYTRKLSDAFIIDPTSLDQTQSLYLAALVRESVTNKINVLLPGAHAFPKNSFTVIQPSFLKQHLFFISPSNNFPTTLNLKYKLMFRECSSDNTKYHFDVYSGKGIHGNEKNHGNFGTIEKLLGTLTLTEDNTLTFKAKDGLVAKLQKFDKELSPNEEEISRRIPYLGAKKSTYYSLANADLLLSNVMHLIPGKDLNYYIECDLQLMKIQRHFQSADQRIHTIIAIIISFLTLHELNIIHADIKPENIMIHMQEKRIQARAIDFGFSADVSKRISNRGSKIYQAPEVFLSQPITQKSDIYSLGWVLAKVMRAINPSVTVDEVKKLANQCVFIDHAPSVSNCLVKSEQKTQKIPQIPIFTNIDGFSSEHREKILISLNEMVLPNPDDRPSLDVVLKIFESVDLERRLSLLEYAERGVLIKAYEEMCSLRISLQNVAKIKSNFYLLLNGFEALFLSAFRAFTENDKYFQLFLERLGLQALLDSVTIGEAELRVKTIVNDYRVYYEKLASFAETLEKELIRATFFSQKYLFLKKIKRQVADTLGMNNGILTLDVLARTAKHFQKVVEVIDRQLNDQYQISQAINLEPDRFSLDVFARTTQHYLKVNETSSIPLSQGMRLRALKFNKEQGFEYAMFVRNNNLKIIEDYDPAMRDQPDKEQLEQMSKTITYRW